MVPSQDCKFINVTPPAAIVDDAAFTTTEIDTKGWDYCTILVSLGATDVAMAALKVTESDTAGSGHVDITGADFSGGLPGATDDNEVWAFFIDLRGRKRYLDLVATAGNGTTGTYMSALAILSRGEEAAYNETTRGLGGQKIV